MQTDEVKKVESMLLKTKLAMLWIFTVFVLLGLPRSAAVNIDQLTLGESLWSTSASLVLFAIPFLCLALKGSWNRMANILFGLFFTVAGILGTAGGLPTLPAAFSLMNAAATVAPALVLYYAYRWPKD